MLCDICNKKEAVLFLDHVSPDNRQKISFCVDCGIKTGIMTSDMKIDLFPRKVLDALKNAAGPSSAGPSAEKCPRCGTERSRFTETKQAGCSGCWDLFVGNAKEFAKSNLHYAGKLKRSPAREARAADRGIEKARKIELLRSRLSYLTASERYEEAIKVRDAIRRIEKPAGHAARKI